MPCTVAIMFGSQVLRPTARAEEGDEANHAGEEAERVVAEDDQQRVTRGFHAGRVGEQALAGRLGDPQAHSR